MAMPREDDPDFAFKLDLRQPVGLPQPHIHELFFRKPRGGDIARIGVPVKRNVFDPLGECEIIGDRMSNMMAALCGLPTPALANMDSMDWACAANLIAMSFIPLTKTEEEGLPSA